MKKSIIAFLFLIALIQTVCGQKIMYGGMQQFGLVFGQSKTNVSFNMINGIRFKRFFTGIGVDAQFNHKQSYSYYSSSNYNTSAVFVDVRYYINKKKNFFVLGDVGLNFINEKIESGNRGKYMKAPGYYAGIGLGFKARLGKEVFYSFDVNYCIRQTRFDYSYTNFIKAQQTDKYDFRQNCLLVRMGIEIF